MLILHGHEIARTGRVWRCPLCGATSPDPDDFWMWRCVVSVNTLPPRVQQIAELIAKHAAKIATPESGRISIAYSGNSLTFRVLPPEQIEVDERCSLLRRAV